MVAPLQQQPAAAAAAAPAGSQQPPPAAHILSESEDFTDNSAENNTREANQEDTTSQQSGVAAVESEYDTASDSPSDGEEEDYDEEESGGEEEEDEDDEDEGTDEEVEDEEDEEEDDDDVIEVRDYEQQGSGAGQTDGAPDAGQEGDGRRKVDDDEDRSNPQYIPKKGTFYEHDDRTAETDPEEDGERLEGDEQRSKRDGDLDDGGGGGGGGGGSGTGAGDHHLGGGSGGMGGSGSMGGAGNGPGGYGGERRGSEKGGGSALKGRKKWQASTDRWTHDRFDESEQAPKSRAELVCAYGYDIRSEDGPPKARRKRRYARGPNQYTRNWEDEDAYQKSSNTEHQRHKKVLQPPRPEEFPELGPNGAAKGGRTTGGGGGRLRATGGGPKSNAGTRQPVDRTESSNRSVRTSGNEPRANARTERARSGDWGSERDRYGAGDRADRDNGGGDEGGDGLRHRNSDEHRAARHSYHNKENKLTTGRNGSSGGAKEKDSYKVINSLQFKNQARIKTAPEGSGGASDGMSGPQQTGAAGGGDGGSPVMHSQSAGALSGSSNSNKMQMTSNGPKGAHGGKTSNDRTGYGEQPSSHLGRANVVTTSASLGSVPSSAGGGQPPHYGHGPSNAPLQQRELQPSQSQKHGSSLKSQGYLDEEHSKYGNVYQGAGAKDVNSRQHHPSGGTGSGGNLPLVSVNNMASAGTHQRSQISPRAIVSQNTPPAGPQQAPSIAMQMHYQQQQQQQPQGGSYGVAQQGGPLPPTHTIQQLPPPQQQQQQQQQQQPLLTQEPSLNRSKRYSTQPVQTPHYHQPTAVYYTNTAPTNGPPGPGDYVTAGPPPPQAQQPLAQPPPPQGQPQYVPAPYGTAAGGHGPPGQGGGGYLQGPPVAPPTTAYLSGHPAQPSPTVGPPQPPQPGAGTVPGGAAPPPPTMNYVPALGPPPQPTAAPVVPPGQYPATAAYPTFQPAYGQAGPVAVPPVGVAGAPPQASAPGAVPGGPPPPTALYQPAGGITYYAPQTQTQAPRPLPTGRRPTAAIPILAPPDRKPATTSTAGATATTGKGATGTTGTTNRTTAAGGGTEATEGNEEAGGGGTAGGGGAGGGTIEPQGPIYSTENIDHILDNMFVQRPVYQPPSRKSPSPALPPTGSEANAAANAAGSEQVETTARPKGADGGSATESAGDTILGDSVKKLSLQDEKMTEPGKESNTAASGTTELIAAHGEE
uniref:Protein CASC3 n=1 Tax=Anopheles albimanus TaxID=7167 RepID=A0A182FBS8_ANOAL